MREPPENTRVVTATVFCPRCHFSVDIRFPFDANDQRGGRLWYDYPCGKCKVQIRVGLVLAEGRTDD